MNAPIFAAALAANGLTIPLGRVVTASQIEPREDVCAGCRQWTPVRDLRDGLCGGCSS